MVNQKQKEFAAFNRDVDENGGYLYTTNARRSSRIANLRLTHAALKAINLHGKKIIDIGCGDGTYTLDLYEAAHPSKIHGVDAAAQAIAAANNKVLGRPIEFSVASAYELPFENASFDIAHVRGLLHHLDRPIDAIREAMRVAPQVLIIEPNGYNPVLKLLERYSQYHIEHNEKSFSPHLLDQWIENLNGKVIYRRYAGLVPFFCPDWMTYLLKVFEPVAEFLPGLKHISCAVYVFVSQQRSCNGN